MKLRLFVIVVTFLKPLSVIIKVIVIENNKKINNNDYTNLIINLEKQTKQIIIKIYYSKQI